jgi:ABC-type antimicrobial peptide transport system permease subunit
MGIRMALGARRSEIRTMVLGRAGRLIAGGLAIGLGSAFVMARLFQPILAPDTSTFIVVALGLSLAAFLAAWFPARRATRVDPLVALRHD